MTEPQTPEPSEPDTELTGLGGWLILPCIGLFLSVAFFLTTIFTTFVPIFTDGTWEALTTPGGETYHALWGPLLLTELVMNIAQLVFAVVLLIWFFSKHRFLPKGMIAFYISGVIVQLIDLVMIDAMPDHLITPGNPGELVRAFFVGLIWSGYFVRSQRVKNTFVN